MRTTGKENEIKAKIIICYVSVTILLLSNCSKNNNDIYDDKYYPNIINLDIVRTMGEDNKYEGDFILVNPDVNRMVVDKSGNIILADELFIKVYDKFGKGLKILGGKGEGPGRYLETPRIFMSPMGYLTALHEENDLLNRLTIYDSDFNLVNDLRLINRKIYQDLSDKYQFTMGKNVMYTNNICALNESEFIYDIAYYTKNNAWFLLIYDNGDSAHVIYHGKAPDVQKTSYAVSGNASLGMVAWDLLNNNKLFYITSEEDTFLNDDYGEFTLHIISLDTYEDKIIKHEFDPMLFPPDLIKHRLDGISVTSKGYQSLKLHYAELEKMYSERKYWGFKGARTDGNYIFIYPRMKYAEIWAIKETQNQTILAFDVETEKFLPPFTLNRLYRKIYNGYIYDDHDDENGWPQIQVYKLDDELLGIK
ncbi:hypothetical protein AMJ80_02635 [bacterium SM23_31]|nr:MAG: hypothetical protein AMJ80_02635 [bacterium SM23_31]